MKNLTPPLPPLKSVRLLDQLRERIRYVHYSIRTEQTYVHWVKAFIRFHGLRHPAEMGRAVVRAGEPGAGALSSRAGLWKRSIDREWCVEQMPAATWRTGFAINGSLPQLHRFHSGSKPAAGCAALWMHCPRWRRHPRGP